MVEDFTYLTFCDQCVAVLEQACGSKVHCGSPVLLCGCTRFVDTILNMPQSISMKSNSYADQCGTTAFCLPA